MHCFEGVTPASIATCDGEGVPNVTLLSQVHYVDEGHVALSCQFFNKTRRNVDQNPYASVRLWDPTTLQPYALQLRFLRAETEGPLFERMSSRIDAIARLTGMEGIFKLLSADVYQVLSATKVDGALLPPGAVPLQPRPRLATGGEQRRAELRGLQELSGRICRARTLEELFDALLESVTSLFAAQHALLLLHDEQQQCLVAIDSKGYERSGAGAEVSLGEGLIGSVAATRSPVKLSGMHAVRRYARAVQQAAREGGTATLREVPLPALDDAQAQLAMPLVANDRLVGVLALESRDPLAFEDWHEAFLGILANQAALAIAVLTERDDEEDGVPVAPDAAPLPARTRRFTWFAADESVFVDGEYLTRNVPARILWKLLNEHAEGRREFTNRELRMDPGLGLPSLRDNLESRLILLRKRLEERCPDVRLVPVKRGRFVLERDSEIVLESKP
ncbi:MAG: GAF domain-containing protein [Myxococcales bacterium]|nr:GAF domain-containing protein [Myxococcales bacterium]MCB9626308.1 GAF domain-containing protein [Sandaracinaceae bacterium]